MTLIVKSLGISGRMRELVPLALSLVELSGSYQEAGRRVADIQVQGLQALREAGLSSDSRLVVERLCYQAGVTDSDGQPDQVRLAELVIVLDLMSAMPKPWAPPLREEPLVFTLPSEVAHLLQPRERLDLLVADVIRDATETLHVGGPFWNDAGLELLRPVLEPAIQQRGVRCSLYVHESGTDHDGVIPRFLEGFEGSEAVKVYWYDGGQRSLMHAKFCVADGRTGYFGSANLTSLGLTHHLEMGVRLSPQQSAELLRLVGALVKSGIFRIR